GVTMSAAARIATAAHMPLVRRMRRPLPGPDGRAGRPALRASTGSVVPMTIRVGVFGAGGRMGATVCGAVAADDGLELVAAVDPHHAGEDIGGVTVAAGPEALAEAGAEVVVDFTVLDAARDNLHWLAEHGMHAVVGTTGFSDDDLAGLRAAFTESNCFI